MLFARAKQRYATRSETAAELPYFWYQFLFVMFAVFSCCAIQIPLFRFTPEFQYLYRLEVFYTLAAAAFLVGVVYVFMGIRVFHVKIDYVLLGIFAVYGIGNLIAVLCHKNFYSFTGVKGSITIPDYQYQIAGQAFVSGVLTSFTLFLFFSFFPAGKKNKYSGSWIYEILILLGLSMALYSLFTEAGEYGKALNEGIFSANIVSYTGSKNVYGNYLLLALFAEAALLERFGRPWRYLMMVFFAVMILFSGSKASLLMAVFVIASLMVYRLIRRKQEKTFAWKKAAIPLGIVAVGVVGVVVLAIAKPNFFASFWNALASFFQNGEGSNVGTRAAIWKDSLALTNQGTVYWLFGQGDVIYSYLMSVAMDVPSYGTAHNVALEILGRGGLLRLAAFGALLGYLGYRFARSCKGAMKDHVFYLILALPLVARGFIESASLFDAMVESIGYAFIVILPWLSPNHLKEETTKVAYPPKQGFPWLRACSYAMILILNIALFLGYSFAGYFIVEGVGLLYLIGLVLYCLIRHVDPQVVGAELCFYVFAFVFQAIGGAAIGYNGVLPWLLFPGSYFIGLSAELAFYVGFHPEKLTNSRLEAGYENSLVFLADCKE
ncbi:MAG: hypothetical protein IJU64_00850 [Bacilli bacterium]|nr:hypothetical protein [Bacilli bacterium]